MLKNINKEVGIIKSNEFYIWDNWGFVDNDSNIHLYGQFCEKDKCKVPEDRYWNVHIEHFVSKDNGKTFERCGPAIEVSDDINAFDSYNIWSGSNMQISDGRVLGFYTGLQIPKEPLPDGRKYALQSISVAISKDGGYTFEKIKEPLISPIRDYDLLMEKGYFLGAKETLGAVDDEDGTFMCLRDPEVYQENGILHIIFGSKALQNGEVRNAVGHAIIKDLENIQNIEIQKPLFIANEKDYNQLELPGIVKRNNNYYLIISTTKLDYIGQPDTEVEKTVRVYISKSLIDHEWQSYGSDGKHIILNNKIDGIYGPKLIHDKNSSQILQMRPFIVGEIYAPPTIGVKVGGFEPKVIKNLVKELEISVT